MAIPGSDVAVCNLALDLLKQGSISTLNPPITPTEALCSRWYDVCRRSVLRSARWNFATKGEALLRGGTPTLTKFTDYYVFPNDYIRLQALVDPEYSLSRYRYQVNGNQLHIDYANATSIDSWFTYDITSVTMFPEDFTIYLAHELAALLSSKITGIKGDIKVAINSEKQKYRIMALAANGQEQPPIRYEQSKIVNAGFSLSANKYAVGDYTFED